MIRNLIPDFAKPLLRLAVHSYARKRYFRERRIRKEQDLRWKQQFDPASRKLIVFIVPGANPVTGLETISGGVLSIVSIAEVTAGMQQVHGAATVICSLQGEALLLEYRNFENRSTIFRFEQLMTGFPQAEEVLVHVPEYMLQFFWDSLTREEKDWLQQRRFFHINILNQNIRYMPEPETIAAFTMMAHKVTITTAHQKYCNRQYRDLYSVPIHKFSVWISPEQYERRAWADKENLLVVSPDPHPEKEAVLELLRSVEGLRVQEIRNLTYAAYKSLIASAKWSLTFGEGLDAYLIEPIFSGAIGIALYNEDFFTPDFKTQVTLYPDIHTLKQQITADLRRFDGTTEGSIYQQEQFDCCARYYSREQYHKNIAAFYRGDYTYA